MEEVKGQPFIGPSGEKAKCWWGMVGLQRSDFYITNVYPFFPGYGNDSIKGVPDDLMASAVEALHQRIAKLTDPYILIPTGNLALRALTGRVGVTKWRGSILTYQDLNGRLIKVIPTLHPAAVLRQPLWEGRTIRDWERIAEECQHKDINLPRRFHNFDPKFTDIDAYLDALDADSVLAIDIETDPSQGTILSVGFASSASESLVIPIINSWGKHAMRDQVWPRIKALCEHPCAKVLHNGLYDTYWLRGKQGIEITNFCWDTMLMHHALDPADDHSLAYVASIDSRENYWKDDGKAFIAAKASASQWERLLIYNGVDACVTRELCDTYHKRLEECGKLRFYKKHYADLLAPILDMSSHGILTHDKARRHRAGRLLGDCIRVQQRLQALNHGNALHAKKDLSTKKVQEFLYKTLALPPILAPKTKRPTSNEVAIKRLMRRHPKVMEEPGKLLLEHRRKYKLLTQLSEESLDDDGRFRSSYSPTADTGRMRSSRNPFGTGGNGQNVTSELRDLYVPDPGCIFLEVDLSQAENRVVWMLTKAKRLVEMARVRPHELDVHSLNAERIFHRKQADMEPKKWKKLRQLGKKCCHANNYDVRAKTFSDALLKDGHYFGIDECQTMLDSVSNAYPEIDAWKRATRIEILNHRMLATPFGRTISFEFSRLNDDTYRRAYAYRPQSIVADALNIFGLVPVHRYLTENPHLGARINAHIHDALLISVPPEHVYEVAAFVVRSLERPINYYGKKMTIWAEIVLGHTWAKGVEYKQMPSEPDLTEVAHGLFAKKVG
jgi:uracil-DNA glycosylase family 4